MNIRDLALKIGDSINCRSTKIGTTTGRIVKVTLLDICIGKRGIEKLRVPKIYLDKLSTGKIRTVENGIKKLGLPKFAAYQTAFLEVTC